MGGTTQVKAPARAQLTRRYGGQPIGYRILSIDRTLYRAFTRRGVIEAQRGAYVAVGGVDSPPEGGYIVWGTEAQDLVEATLPASPPDIAEAVRPLVAREVERLEGRIPSLLIQPALPPVIVNTNAFEARVSALDVRLTEVAQDAARNQDARVAALTALVTEIRSEFERLGAINEVVQQLNQLDEAAKHLNCLALSATRLLDANKSYDHLAKIAAHLIEQDKEPDRFAEIGAQLEALQVEVAAISEAAYSARQGEEMWQRSMAILDDFLDKTKGGPLRFSAEGRFREAASVAEKWRVMGPVELRLQRAMRRAFLAQGRKFVQGFGVLRGRFQEAGGGPWWRQKWRAMPLPNPPLGEGTVLREAIHEDDWLRVFDVATRETIDLFLDPIQAAARAALAAGADATLAEVEIDIAFNLANPRAVQYLDEHGYGLISQINEVTRGNIATIVSNGVNEGWSYNRMAREISSLYSEMAVGKPQAHIESRAHLIAITEAGQAYEAGSNIVVRDLQEAGLAMEKKWLTVGDDRVSQGCRDNAAEGWIPYSQAFSSGHQHPLRFPGCRCTTLYQRAKK